MFRTVSIVGFIVLILAIITSAAGKKAAKGSSGGSCKCGGGLFIRAIRTLVAFFTLVFFVVLIVTGFYPQIVLKQDISGYLLMLHATAAPAFAVCLALAALLWADRSRLNKNYVPALNKLIKRQPTSTEPPKPGELARKLSFWVVMIVAIPLIMSIVLSMLPIFGTHMQKVMASVHRYCALVVALVGIYYVYLSMRKTA